jgi:hypothetical protein
VRIAEEKFVFNKQFPSYWESVAALWKQSLQPLAEKCDLNKWRQTRFWNEECDLVLKNYQEITNNVYKNYSKKKVKPGHRPFMCLDEFMEVLKKCDLVGENMPEKDVNLAFNSAMMVKFLFKFI